MNRGYTTLLSVLILGAIGLAVSVFLILSGLGVSRSSLTVAESAQAFALANWCVEEALQNIHDANAYSGLHSYSFSTGNCSHQVIDGGGSNRTIQSIGTINSTVRKVRVTIDTINPSINVVLWQEVADF